MQKIKKFKRTEVAAKPEPMFRIPKHIAISKIDVITSKICKFGARLVKLSNGADIFYEHRANYQKFVDINWDKVESCIERNLARGCL